MELQIIATRDVVSDLYSVPMFIPSIGGAVRAFGDECLKATGQFGQHPEDFELWHMGTYDDHTGTITAFAPLERKQIAVGANYRNITGKNPQ